MALTRLACLQKQSASGGLSSRSSSPATTMSVSSGRSSVHSDIGPATSRMTAASASVGRATGSRITPEVGGVFKSRSLDLRAAGVVKIAHDVEPPTARGDQCNDDAVVRDRCDDDTAFATAAAAATVAAAAVTAGDDRVSSELPLQDAEKSQQARTKYHNRDSGIGCYNDEIIVAGQSSAVDSTSTESRRMTAVAVVSEVTIEKSSLENDAVKPVDRDTTSIDRLEIDVRSNNDKLDVTPRTRQLSSDNYSESQTRNEVVSNVVIDDVTNRHVSSKTTTTTLQVVGSSPTLSKREPVSSHSTKWSSSPPVTDAGTAVASRTQPAASQAGSRSIAAVRKNFESAATAGPAIAPKPPPSSIGGTRTGGATERRKITNIGFLTASSSGNTSSNSASSVSKPKRAPMFVRKMRNVTVIEGETARFDVLVDANPMPTIVWMKDGVELNVDASSGVAKYKTEYSAEEGRWSLLVAECGEDDDAEYGCRAVNSLGQVASKAELYVEPAGGGEE